ncbi:Smr/MutS family protein [Maribacter sp. 2307ULW6-5]|uniref:Smr/MutS family protein n=1 Tax=Maribacter sp. 2307ULW6-5 TaxID=3386275 RepID=UPI0039BC3EFB
MVNYKVGDRVEVLDDVIKGRVTAVNGAQVTLLTEDGFPMRFHSGELVQVQEEIRVTNAEVAQIKKEKTEHKRKHGPAPKPKERNVPKMEVDLHIHQLVRNPGQLSNHEMLNLQLETAKRQLAFAMEKRIQKVVFIHGVGEGVLREELHYLFGRYDNLKYYAADYQKYGMGATEVYIFQNTGS